MEYGATWFLGPVGADPESPAVSDSGAALTLSELVGVASSIASDLGRAEARIVGVGLEASVDWAAAVVGAWLAQAAVMPLDPRLDGATLAGRRGSCDIVIGPIAPEAGGTLSDAEIDPLSPAVILHTSGSTGEAQQVMLSHGNLAAQAGASREALAGARHDRWLSALPVAHAGGFSVLARCLGWGAEAVLRDRFDADEFCQLLSDPDEGVTLVSLVPTMLSRLLDCGLERPPTLRRAVVSGAPLHEGLRAAALERGIPVVQAWGMTETFGMAAVEREPGEGGCGSALPGVHIEISGEGEIRVGGPTVAPGMTVGGMLDTGDAGSLRNGRLEVAGRFSTRINTGGEKVVPERVEAVLISHPQVSDCLVSGEPDPEWGERVVARIVSASGELPEDLATHCSGLLAPWEVPKEFIPVPSIERSGIDKPSRVARDGGR